MVVKKIGLLGGSFDPIHPTHIQLANTALRHLALDEVQLLPAADPWQRASLGAPAIDRLNMVKLAIQGQQGLAANDAEIRRGGQTYTIDTLQALPENARYFWILGSDQLSNFCTWHRWQDILDYVQLAVAERPGSTTNVPASLANALKARESQILKIPFTPSSLSATQIRTALHAGHCVDTLIDPKVLAYIQQKQLYSN